MPAGSKLIAQEPVIRKFTMGVSRSGCLHGVENQFDMKRRGAYNFEPEE